jgi:diguanylate cyclase (GGDEF)-like protein
MNWNRVIQLNLGDGSADRAAAWRLLTTQAIALLASALSEEEGGSFEGLTPCLEALPGGGPLTEFEALWSRAVVACDARIKAMRAGPPAAQELGSALALVREAVETMANDGKTFDDRVVSSADRFMELAKAGDPVRMKVMLAAEVQRLKAIMTERRQRRDATVRDMADQVERLERRLADTRLEASLDPLTKVANRRRFDQLCQEWIRATRSAFVLALLDVDRFKTINDTLGHPIGDEVLVAVAGSVRASLRSDDVIARIGGDEFAVLVRDVTLPQAYSRLRQVIAAASAAGTAVVTAPVTVTLSCGVAEYSAGDTLKALVKRADEAMYEAKGQGGNRVAGKAGTYIRDHLHRQRDRFAS